MRAVAAAILTTAVPMLVGQRFVSGLPVVRWSLGAVVGIVLVAMGGLFGGLVGSPLTGAVLMLLISWPVAQRVRWDAGLHTLSPAARRALVVVLGAGSALMIMSLFRPVASWDAWFQWSLKSKGLALAGSFESPVFLSPTYNWSSQEYPPLLPSWQALAYIISGDLSVSWPLQFQQAWLWTAGAIALVALTAGHLERAFLLPLAWVVTPGVVWQSMQGYADIPMALMLVLGTTVLWKNRSDPRAHVLAGVLFAGAALTKAEGTPLVMIVLLALVVTKKPRMVLALAPAIVILARLPWYLFTEMHGMTNQWINVKVVKGLILSEIPEQLRQIVSTMGFAIFSPFRWGVLLPACLIAGLLARRLDARLGAAALLQLVLFAVVYVATWRFQGATLEAFLQQNVDRVITTPLGIFALAVALGSWGSEGSARDASSNVPEKDPEPASRT